MKKSILTYIIASVIITYVTLPTVCVVKPTAGASACYAMAVNDQVVFYADASGKFPRFFVDKGYFVYVTDIVGDFARVNYMEGFENAPSLEGYVKTVDLSFFDKRVSSPYPDVTLFAAADAVTFADAEMTKPRTVIPINAQVRYYGAYVSGGNRLYYVYYQGYVGYVSASAFNEVYIEPHPEYVALTSPTSADAPVASAQSDDGNASSVDKAQKDATDPTAVIIITLLVIVGLVVLYLIIRPDRLGGAKTVSRDDDE